VLTEKSSGYATGPTPAFRRLPTHYLFSNHLKLETLAIINLYEIWSIQKEVILKFLANNSFWSRQKTIFWCLSFAKQLELFDFSNYFAPDELFRFIF